MHLFLHIWRQQRGVANGRIVDYEIDVTADTSFLEMLDLLNETLIRRGEDPVAFDHDCREGICGTCSLVINGLPHGPDKGCATCQVRIGFSRAAHRLHLQRGDDQALLRRDEPEPLPVLGFERAPPLRREALVRPRHHRLVGGVSPRQVSSPPRESS